MPFARRLASRDTNMDPVLSDCASQCLLAAVEESSCAQGDLDCLCGQESLELMRLSFGSCHDSSGEKCIWDQQPPEDLCETISFITSSPQQPSQQSPIPPQDSQPSPQLNYPVLEIRQDYGSAIPTREKPRPSWALTPTNVKVGLLVGICLSAILLFLFIYLYIRERCARQRFEARATEASSAETSHHVAKLSSKFSPHATIETRPSLNRSRTSIGKRGDQTWMDGPNGHSYGNNHYQQHRRGPSHGRQTSQSNRSDQSSWPLDESPRIAQGRQAPPRPYRPDPTVYSDNGSTGSGGDGGAGTRQMKQHGSKSSMNAWGEVGAREQTRRPELEVWPEHACRSPPLGALRSSSTPASEASVWRPSVHSPQQLSRPTAVELG